MTVRKATHPPSPPAAWRWPSPRAAATTTRHAGSDGGDKGTVGVAMPTKSSERWIADGDNIKEQLEEAGYKVDLQYAEDDIPTQVNQIENMITKGAKMLVVASIDGTALGDVLEKAKEPGHPGHRLRPADPRHRRRRLLRHLRQLQGRRAAGRVARRGPRRPSGARARSTSSSSPARRTTTTPRSSSTAR